MCAAGLAVLAKVGKPDFLKAATEAGLYLESELQKLSTRHGLGEVRGSGAGELDAGVGEDPGVQQMLCGVSEAVVRHHLAGPQTRDLQDFGFGIGCGAVNLDLLDGVLRERAG